MNLNTYGDKEQKLYIEEAKKRWGDSPAFKEYNQRLSQNKKADGSATEKFMSLFAEIGKVKTLPADSIKAREEVEKLKNFITENFYTCTDEILKGLGEMYMADLRFKENIDLAGGEGTAKFISEAIRNYCKNGE